MTIASAEINLQENTMLFVTYILDKSIFNRGDYLTLFTEPEENNVVIRATAFSFILLVSTLKTSKNCAIAILKLLIWHNSQPISVYASL